MFEEYGDHGGHSRELNESNFRFIMGSLFLMTISFGISALRVFCCGNNLNMTEKMIHVRKKSSANYLASRIILNRNYEKNYSHQVSVWNWMFEPEFGGHEHELNGNRCTCSRHGHGHEVFEKIVVWTWTWIRRETGVHRTLLWTVWLLK